MWGWILAASGIAFATKLSGYLLPDSWLASPRVLAITNTVTIGLLAALVATNTVASGQEIVVDARLVALILAIIALKAEVPFLAVVVLGAAGAALARLAGLG